MRAVVPLRDCRNASFYDHINQMNMKTKYFNLLIIALSIHLFFVNARLLYELNGFGGKRPEVPENQQISVKQNNRNKNSFIEISFAMVIALSYSMGTAAVLRICRDRKLVWYFAILDSTGVLLHYWHGSPEGLRAIYFAVYTGLLIISTSYLDNSDDLQGQIIELKKKGLIQRDIARRLNISESKVSREIKRVNGVEA